MLQSVAGGQVAAEAVAQKHHLADAHLAPPLFNGHNELLLRAVRVGWELGPAALPEPEQVERVHLPLLRQRFVVENLNVGAALRWCWSLKQQKTNELFGVRTVLVFFNYVYLFKAGS